jgi:hypothetical protein
MKKPQSPSWSIFLFCFPASEFLCYVSGESVRYTSCWARCRIKDLAMHGMLNNEIHPPLRLQPILVPCSSVQLLALLPQ